MAVRITHEKYLENLKNRNIEVKPIEKYIKANTKIKHKCTCGNIWEVMPLKVYRGDTCGCNYNISNEKYMRMLNKKNIKVIPLEDYKGVKVKIKHKCTCGNIWEVTPDSILQGSSCGCKGNVSNERYAYMLNEKNIKVIPLEDYKGVRVKIKHKCTCDNIWVVTPDSVLRGTKCGCDNTPNERYACMLNEKNIKVIPLEDYKGITVKIKHKCTCGNIWVVTPNSVLQGSKCGCGNKKAVRRNRNIKTYKDRKTLLYYVTIDEIPKIGICLLEKYKEPEDAIFKYRYCSEKKNHDIKIIDYKVYCDGAEAFTIEWAIKNRLKEFKYTGPNFIRGDKGGGESECFNKDVYYLVKKYFI